MDPIRLLLGADDAYAMQMTVSAHSALYHLDCSKPVELHILDGGISAENRLRSESVLRSAHPKVDLYWRLADLQNFNGLNFGIYSASAMIRLLTPWIFPDLDGRLLYLDSDVVVTDDISQLWQIELGDFPVWAVINGEAEQFANDIAGKFSEVTGSEDARYFNSGVLLINLCEWQHQKISEKALNFLRTHSEKLSFPDQDALNAVIAGNWGALSPRWNKQVIRIGQPESASVRDRGITHYTSYKPWNRDYTWRCNETFFHAYMRSGWDSAPRALVWSAARYAEQVMRRNTARIAHRLRGSRP